MYGITCKQILNEIEYEIITKIRTIYKKGESIMTRDEYDEKMEKIKERDEYFRNKENKSVSDKICQVINSVVNTLAKGLEKNIR